MCNTYTQRYGTGLTESHQVTERNMCSGKLWLGEAKVYTKDLLSSEKPSVPQQVPKKRFGIHPNSWVLSDKGKYTKHQRAFQVFARDLAARYWCIDFGQKRKPGGGGGGFGRVGGGGWGWGGGARQGRRRE